MRTKFRLAVCFLLCFCAQSYGQTVGPTNFNGGGSGSGAIIVSSAPSSCVAGAIYINTIGGVMYFGETGNVCVTAGGASGLTSLNGLTGATQTFATGTTGTAFGIVSSGTTHTFNIPMAATSSVTAGLLSNTDYAAFAAKQAALGYTAANAALSNLSGTPTLCSGGQFSQGISSGSNNCSTPSGGGGVGTGTQYGDAFYDTTTTVASNTPAAVNGMYQVVHNVTAGAAVAPTEVLPGIPVNAQTGSTYTLAYSDRGTFIRVSGGTTFTLTLPTAATNLASNLPFIVGNFNSDTLRLTPTTPNNIDGGSGQASETLPSNWAALVYQDAGSPINWWMVKFPMIGGSGGANPALSNLAGVAINTDLLPASAGSVNLGNASYPFGSLYFNGSLNYVGSSAFALSGTPGTCPVAGTNLGQLCMSSTGNRPVYSYNGGANTNVMLASDTSFGGNAATTTGLKSPAQLGLANGFAFGLEISTNPAEVGGTTLANFPMYFTFTYSQLATVANGGVVTNANCYDCVLTSDSGASSLMTWEIESYNPATGTITGWVLIPSLSASTAVNLYLWAGKSSISSFQGGSQGAVWSADASYHMVQHLGNGTTLSVADSTTNAINGTLEGSTTPAASAGQLDGAASFNGTTAYVAFPYNSALNLTTGLTVVAWVNPAGATNRVIVGKPYASTQISPYFDWLMYLSFGPQVTFRIGSTTLNTASGATPVGNWTQVIETANGSHMDVYVNGVLSTSNSSSALPTNTNSEGVVIGSDVNGLGEFWSGSIDEIEVLNAAKPANWVTAVYNNQRMAGNFYSVAAISSTSSQVAFVANGCAATWADPLGVIRKIELFACSGIIYDNASTVGSLEWAINQLGTNGGQVLMHPGIYNTASPVLIDWDWITIEGTELPYWSAYQGVWGMAHDTPGTPGGAQIVSSAAYPTFEIGNTTANMHGDSRHKGIEIRRVYGYGSYVGTSFIVDVTPGQDDDNVRIEDNIMQGYESCVIIDRWDYHDIFRNSIQNNAGDGVCEAGGLYGDISRNIFYDNGGEGVTLSGGTNTIVSYNRFGNLTSAGTLSGGTGIFFSNVFGGTLTTPLTVTAAGWEVNGPQVYKEGSPQSTVGLLECFTASGTVADCSSASTNFIGVATQIASSVTTVASAGIAIVNFASASPSAGWYACSTAISGTSYNVVVQSSACTAGEQIGILQSGGSTITQAPVLIQIK